METKIRFNESVVECVDEKSEFVSDFLKYEVSQWTPGMNVFISCGTGTGKTTFAKNLSVLTGGRTLILSNRVANLKQTRKGSNYWKA